MDKDRPILNVEELRKKMEAGEKIEGFHIERINISKKEITTPIHIVDCTIDVLDCNSSTLHEDVTVRRCEIDTLVVSEAVFLKKCDFKRSSIRHGKCQRTQFKGDVSFESARLQQTTFFQSIFTGEDVDFSRTIYPTDATFSEVEFANGAKFVHADFSEKATFKKTKWGGKAIFTNIECRDDLELQDSQLNGEVLFNNSVFHLSNDLTKATLNGRTDFSNVKIDRSLILAGVVLGNAQGFVFRNACITSLVFSRETVEGHVFPEQDKRYLEASREYAFLRTSFQHINLFDDEDWAYYKFKKCERMGQPFGYNPLRWFWRMLEYIFLDLGCGYGTKPFRTLGLALTLVLFFGLAYTASLDAGPSPETYGISCDMTNKVIYGFNISLIAFSGGYSDLPIQIHGAVKLLAMVEYMIGVVLMGLFVVSFSRKVIR